MGSSALNISEGWNEADPILISTRCIINYFRNTAWGDCRSLKELNIRKEAEWSGSIERVRLKENKQQWRRLVVRHICFHLNARQRTSFCSTSVPRLRLLLLLRNTQLSFEIGQGSHPIPNLTDRTLYFSKLPIMTEISIQSIPRVVRLILARLRMIPLNRHQPRQSNAQWLVCNLDYSFSWW